MAWLQPSGLLLLIGTIFSAPYYNYPYLPYNPYMTALNYLPVARAQPLTLTAVSPALAQLSVKTDLGSSIRPVRPRLPASPGPAGDFALSVNPLAYAQLALSNPIAVTSSILAPRDSTSPNAAAALAYMKATPFDDICARSTKVYLEKILAGSSVDQANADATAKYIQDYNSGLRVEPGSACEASDVAWRKAEAEGKDPVVASAIAFMQNWPGLKAGNPCAVSGIEYVNNILQGSSHLEANRNAAKVFGDAIKVLAAQGRELKDPACAAATKAYFNALPEKPSPPNAAAMIAFLDKALTSFSFQYDPVCWKATEAFFDSYASGADELTSNLVAAEAFLDEFSKAGLQIPADSPCAAATRAYYQNIPNPPSPPNKAAMEAFMDQMIAGGKREPDPVCAASTKAYWKAYKAGAKETDANLAAAEEFFKAFSQGLSIPAQSPCAVSTKAYFNALDTKPSPPNAVAMIAFMDAMIAQGNRRAPDPVCAASSLAYFEAFKAGDDELTSNFKAAQAFFREYKKGAQVPTNSPCLISTRAYADAIKNKPSPPNAAAMIAFMDEAILTNMDKPDPVCLASAEAYFDAYANGAGEAKANEIAGVAFLDAVAATPDFQPGSPCGISAKAYMATFDVIV